MIRLIHHYPLQDAFVSPPNHRSQLSRAKEHVSSCPAGRPRGHRSGLTNRGLAPAEMEIFRFVWDMFGSEIGEVQDRIVGKMGRSIEVLSFHTGVQIKFVAGDIEKILSNWMSSVD